MLGGGTVCGEVVGELAMSVDEGRLQRRGGHRSVDPVVDPGGVVAGVAELMGVAPPPDQPGRPGHRARRRQYVDESVGRLVLVRTVLGHPAQSGRKPQHGATVGQ